MNKAKEEWEEELDIKWYLWDRQNDNSYVTCGEEVKDFIKKQLEQRDKDLIKWAKEKEKTLPVSPKGINGYYVLRDLIRELKK